MPDRFLIVIDSPAGGLSWNAFDGSTATARLRLSCGADVPVSRTQLPELRIRLHSW
jgi:hypothetical protein